MAQIRWGEKGQAQGRLSSGGRFQGLRGQQAGAGRTLQDSLCGAMHSNAREGSDRLTGWAWAGSWAQHQASVPGWKITVYCSLSKPLFSGAEAAEGRPAPSPGRVTPKSSQVSRCYCPRQY